MPHVDEGALVARAKAGDGDAFGALYAHHADEVRAFILSRVRDANVADDVTGAAWLTAWSALGQYENDGRPFLPWVIGIAKYKVLRAHVERRHRSRHEHDDLDRDGRPRNLTASTAPSTEAQALARIGLAEVIAVMDRLTVRQRRALLLRARQGLSDHEIARRMGTTVDAAAHLISAARQQLREAVGYPQQAAPAGSARGALEQRRRVRALLAKDPSLTAAQLAARLGMTRLEASRRRREIVAEDEIARGGARCPANMPLPEAARTLVLGLGLTRERAAVELGVSRQTIRRWIARHAA